MRINNNIQALNAYRNLYQNQSATSKNLERLSSGMRINRAADDAAGLAISEKMRSQIRGLKQAERNSLDGISLMQTAEGAMTEVHSMLQRMRELAVQAANDTNTTSDRTAIQLEIDELRKEIDSIAAKTEFNTRKLLDGSSAVDTQYIAGEMGKTNIKNVPIVTDPSMATGRYQIGIEGTPEIVNKLNQPGAGVSDRDVIEIPLIVKDAKVDSTKNGAGVSKVTTSTADAGSYTVKITDKETEVKNFNASSSLAEGDFTFDKNVLVPGDYKIEVEGYASGTPDKATFKLTDPDGKVITLTDYELDKAVDFGNGIKIEDHTKITENGTITFNVETTANVSINGGTPEPVTFTNNTLKTVDVDGFKIDLDATKIADGTTTVNVTDTESQLGFGEYTIVVTGQQLDSNGRPSATIEVFGPDGFSIGKLASLIGDPNGGKQTIGTESGKSVIIDTSKITQAGTAKVQIEAKVEVSVSMVSEDGTTTPITFPKELTTSNGKLTHGGLEMEFGANIKEGTSQFDLTNKALAFQIGANTNQNVMIDVPQLSTVKLGIDEIDVLSHESANMAIFKLGKAINDISSTRAKLGATQNRLEHTINNLQVTHENLSSAESRIRDADMALEMTEFTKNNILNQAAQAMLAQANQLPQGVLQLLQG